MVLHHVFSEEADFSSEKLIDFLSENEMANESIVSWRCLDHLCLVLREVATMSHVLHDGKRRVESKTVVGFVVEVESGSGKANASKEIVNEVNESEEIENGTMSDLDLEVGADNKTERSIKSKISREEKKLTLKSSLGPPRP